MSLRGRRGRAEIPAVKAGGGPREAADSGPSALCGPPLVPYNAFPGRTRPPATSYVAGKPNPKGAFPMRNTATLLLALAALAACEPHRPGAGGTDPRAPEPAEVADETPEAPDWFAGMNFMGTAAERAARAPYSPLGWPLQRGDSIPFARWRELEEEFPGWSGGVSMPFWIGTTVFGAYDLLAGGGWSPNIKYIGHYPAKTYDLFWTYHIPDHLKEMSQTAEGFAEIAKSVFDPDALRKTFEELPEKQRVWTREAWLDGYTGEEGGGGGGQEGGPGAGEETVRPHGPRADAAVPRDARVVEEFAVRKAERLEERALSGKRTSKSGRSRYTLSGKRSRR